MKRVCGFALINMSVGMLVVFLLPATSVFRVLLFLACVAGGYFLFCKSRPPA